MLSVDVSSCSKLQEAEGQSELFAELLMWYPYFKNVKDESF